MKLIFTIATLIFAAQPGAAPDPGDKPLGSVLGRTITASQLGDTTGYKREQQMRSLFVKPLFDKWKDDHPHAVTPTAKEEATALDCARTALASSRDPVPDIDVTAQQLVDLQLPSWKFQQSIYRAYGGGSTLFQQLGIEAYAATRRFLEDAESEGEFSFENKAARKTVYAYWNLGEDDWRVQSGPKYTAYFNTPPPCVFVAEKPSELKK